MSAVATIEKTTAIARHEANPANQGVWIAAILGIIRGSYLTIELPRDDGWICNGSLGSCQVFQHGHEIAVIVIGYSGVHVWNGSDDTATATKGIDEALAWLHISEHQGQDVFDNPCF